MYPKQSIRRALVLTLAHCRRLNALMNAVNGVNEAISVLRILERPVEGDAAQSKLLVAASRATPLQTALETLTRLKQRITTSTGQGGVRLHYKRVGVSELCCKIWFLGVQLHQLSVFNALVEGQQTFSRPVLSLLGPSRRPLR